MSNGVKIEGRFKGASGKTILAFSIAVLLVLAINALMAFKVIPSSLITSAMYSGLWLVVGSLALLLETWAEGKRPNITKDIGAIISTLFGALGLIVGLMIMMGKDLSPTIAGIMGITYVIIFILLGRELLFD